jgi:hypothetical protein
LNTIQLFDNKKPRVKTLDGEVFAWLERELKLTKEEKSRIGAMIFKRCGGFNTFNLAAILFTYHHKEGLNDWVSYATAALSNKTPSLTEFECFELKAKGVLNELRNKI